MKVIPDSLLRCLERISDERYGLLRALAAERMFPPADLERIVEEFTIQRYNLYRFGFEISHPFASLEGRPFALLEGRPQLKQKYP